MSAYLLRTLHCLALVLVLVLPGPAGAMSTQVLYEHAREFFPAATQISGLKGEPPVSRVWGPDDLLGYCFLTDQLHPIPGYSGKPIRVLVGVDVNGVIQGVRIIEHEEPILGAGISETELREFVTQYKGLSVDKKIKIGGRPRAGYHKIDAISGATITMMVINASITRSLEEIAAAYLHD